MFAASAIKDMIDSEKRRRIIDLMMREIVPAVGCTEPVAVALCACKAAELLGEVPARMVTRLSGNILKNAMGVGIPGTGMIGLPIALALGVLIGRSEYQLEVLKDVTPEAVERGKRYVAEGRIAIEHIPDTPSNLYIDVEAFGDDGRSARAVIAFGHTRFIRLERDGEVLMSDDTTACEADPCADDLKLDLATVYEFATETPLNEIEFILEAKRLNKSAAQLALDGDFGHSLGATIRRYGIKYYGDTPVEHMIALTSAACDARMGGAPISVMSNSGSGNQGITATMPVVSFADDMGATDEQTIRALVISHLTSIYIKQSLGRLSALCGCVVASTGASGALVYLMGGGYKEMSAAIKNMVANLTGMICDGAKPSCAMKISSGVSTAMMSAMLAMNGKCVTSAEGIVHDDVDATIHNLTSIGREAMTETDHLILKIMTSK